MDSVLADAEFYVYPQVLRLKDLFLTEPSVFLLSLERQKLKNFICRFPLVCAKAHATLYSTGLGFGARTTLIEHMTLKDADRLLEASFSRPTATPSGWCSDRKAYVAEQKALLRRCQIDPVRVRAVASAWAQKYMGYDDHIRWYFALAHDDDQWLLYSESNATFAKAQEGAPAEPLELVGFESDDALAEWLG